MYLRTQNTFSICCNSLNNPKIDINITEINKTYYTYRICMAMSANLQCLTQWSKEEKKLLTFLMLTSLAVQVEWEQMKLLKAVLGLRSEITNKKMRSSSVVLGHESDYKSLPCCLSFLPLMFSRTKMLYYVCEIAKNSPSSNPNCVLLSSIIWWLHFLKKAK